MIGDAVLVIRPKAKVAADSPPTSVEVYWGTLVSEPMFPRSPLTTCSIQRDTGEVDEVEVRWIFFLANQKEDA